MSNEKIEIEIEDNFKFSPTENVCNFKNRFEPYPFKMTPNNTAPLPPVDATTAQPIFLFSVQELTALTNSLPEFYPDSNLSTFITNVDNLGNFLNGKLTPTQTYLFNVSILSKIKKEARDYLNFHNQTEWPGIRSALLNKYGDQRNEELLLSALRSTIQKRNESYNEYYDRVLLAQNELLQYVQLHEDGNIFQFKSALYQNQSLQMFCSGLLEPYRSHLINFELTTLDDALNKCRMYDNKLQENNYTDYMRRLQDNRPSKPITPQSRPTLSNARPNFQSNFQQNNHQRNFQPNYQNNFQNNSQSNSRNFQPNHQNNFQNNFQRQQFQSQTNFSPQRPQFQPKPFSGDINKPLKQATRFPSGKHIFQNKPQQQYRPEPMSVQTSAFTFKPKNNHFQNTSKPTFTSEELFNTEVIQENHEPNVEEYYDEDENYEHENYCEDSQETENFQLQASDNTHL